MLAPAAAAISAGSSPKELQRFLKDSTRYGICISLPVMVFLAVDGGPLLQIWMGKGYADATLMLLLTLGFAAEVIYQPLNTLLLGLNLHGRPGLFSVVAAACAVAFTYLALALGGGMNAIALAIGIPWSILNGIYLPFYACRRLHVSARSFLQDVWTRPLCAVLPFGLCLGLARWIFATNPIVAVLVGGGVGAITLLVSYWFLILSSSWKEKARRKIGLGRLETAETVHPGQEELQPDLVSR